MKTRQINAENDAGGERLISVDALRGFVMGNIMFISVSRSMPPDFLPEFIARHFEHSSWHGLIYADIGFPGFVMLMGLSISLSLTRMRDSDFFAYFRRIAIRSASLVFIGFLYNGGFTEEWPGIRLPGVLQRLGVCYFFAALIYRWTNVAGRVVALSTILVVYWGMLALIPVPGGIAGDYSFDGNLVAWIDSQLLPGRLLYGDWDPNGLLGTFPATGSVIVGMLWGDLLLSSMSAKRKTLSLLAIGIVSINLAVILDTVLPINKPMWTSSYVLVTAGVGTLFLGGFYYLVEELNWSMICFPMVVIGKNILAAFVLIKVIPFHDIALLFTGGDVMILFGVWSPLVTAFVEYLLAWGVLLLLYRYDIALRF